MSGGNKVLAAALLALACLFSGCRQTAPNPYVNLEEDLRKLISEENTIGFSPLIDRSGRLTRENWKYTDIIKNVLIREGLIEPYSTADDVFRELNRRYLRWNDVPALETLLDAAGRVHLDYLIVMSIEDYAVTDYPRITIGMRIYRVRDGRLLYYDEQPGEAVGNQYNIPGMSKKSEMELTVESSEPLIERFAANIEPYLKAIKESKIKKVRNMIKESETLGLREPDAKWIRESLSLLEDAEEAGDRVRLRDVRCIFQIENRLHAMIVDYRVKQEIGDLAQKP